ncbi:MAG: hypothetical protein ACFFF9_06725 [Candidatus Thorarchaeota archaeon]
MAVVVGSTLIVWLTNLTQPTYPEPFDVIWMLLIGSSTLQSTLSFITDVNNVLAFLASWIVIGVIIGPFSKFGWNTVRSVLWVGFIHAILSLASLLLLNPAFWEMSSRNFELLYQFATSMIVALLALPSALLSALLIKRIRTQTDPPIPVKIETICECGAVFKSRPMLCSECGRKLSD